MKYLLAGAWIALNLLFRNSPGTRRFFAFAGSILALVHICALVFGMIETRYYRRPVESGVPLGGFLIGILAGILLGVLTGSAISRNYVLYWAVQVVVAGFLIFLPLLRI